MTVIKFISSPFTLLVNNDTAPQFLKFVEALLEMCRGLGVTGVIENQKLVSLLLTGSG